MPVQSLASLLSSYALDEDKLERASLYYRETPFEALGRLKKLWQAQKGLPGPLFEELILMVNALSIPFERPWPRITLESKLWDACLEVELYIFALEMFKDPDFFKRPEIWIFSVLLLNKGVADLWRLRANDKRDDTSSKWRLIPDSMVETYLLALISVWDIMWDQREHLISMAKQRMNALALYVYKIMLFCCEFYPEHQQKVAKDSSSIVGIALICWMDYAPHVQHPTDGDCTPFKIMKLYRNCVKQVIDAEGRLENEDFFWRPKFDAFIEVVGPQAFMRTVYTALSSDSLVGVGLLYMLEVLEYTVGFRHRVEDDDGFPMDYAVSSPTRRAFFELDMLTAVAKSLERDYHNYIALPSSTPASVFAIREPAGTCINFCNLLQFTSEGLLHYDKHRPVVDGLSVYRVLSGCLRYLYSSLETKGQLDSIETVAKAVNLFQCECQNWVVFCVDRPRDRSVALQRIKEGLIAAMQKFWYIDLTSLRAQQDKLSGDEFYDIVLRSWIQFGQALGLDETSERDEHAARRKRFCYWAECPLFTQPSSTALSACKGCGEPHYCSRDCQLKDWKEGGHRRKCRRLHAT